MKFNIIALAALLTTAAAQGLGDLPDCSKECATGAIPKSCGIDFKCICEAKSFLNDVSCCVADKCSAADQETTLKVAKSICARGGVTDLPTEVTCSSSSSSSGTKTSTEASASTSISTGSTTASASDASTTNTSSTSSDSSSSASASAAATSTGAAMPARKDSALMAAAGAAAAFAILI
ncbi:hypothetical protein N7499_007113 [Penicillium canescens]|uniref:CFEM domain-containing protein n=1 Tax=Penicillium canescens TaxID=5083 RepID=A0AAD6IES6_PENCN|nr:uncharacterized protein N7446_002804 [Penicillium canescens]KAJ5996569.1 hypothetical protein N7522_008229 [Penicillium canescens]KAJ6044611.1 hypothetical protein N7460_005966 [Penicillium canescens]KAJ6056081.1 hypothetical protein N7444_005179 [Penicillium canescens]KAJ6075027.1 hypothetical protein N7446_002804 [Penicillium canescens]KAJ6082239.1 hypothetical protein N7499_007113 [Penicillium canescens]